jgi:WhiB family transcriptional regulator, redox-sensing transcriptional regulator
VNAEPIVHGDYVASLPVATRLRALRDSGVPLVEISKATGIGYSTLRNLANRPQHLISRDMHNRIMSVPIPATARVDFEWVALAACHGQPTVWWFPATEDVPGASETPDTKQARAICRTCPVMKECRDHAVTHNERGIWGGTTGSERRALRRARRKKK